MKTEKFKLLLHAYINNKLHVEDYKEFFELSSQFENDQIISLIEEFGVIEDFNKNELLFLLNKEYKLDYDDINHKILNKIQLLEVQELEKTRKPRVQNLYLYAAASILILIGFIFFIDHKSLPSPSISSVALQNEDILPGVNKAIIQLDGQIVKLGDYDEGLDLRGGEVKYFEGQKVIKSSINQVKNLTIKVPRGGQYKFLLPDGSKIFLNAESKLSYTNTFNKNNREVSFEGEGYFEVAHQKELPFVLKLKNQKIEVLGTEFNVKSYPNDHLSKTTLVEGAIKYSVDGEAFILKPSEQIRYNSGNKLIKKTIVDVAGELVWVKGVINLHGLTLDEGMKFISRWYNIDFLIDDSVPPIVLGGKMNKGVKLSSFIQFLEQSYGLKVKLTNDNKLLIKK